MSSGILSMRRQEFACARLSSPYMTRSQPRLFHNVHHRDLATEAAYGCLEPPPAGRLRRADLHLSYSMAPACLHDTIPNPTYVCRPTTAAVAMGQSESSSCQGAA